MNVELWMWFSVLGLILVMLAIDLFAHRKAHEISVKEAAYWSLFWVTLGNILGGAVMVGGLYWLSDQGHRRNPTSTAPCADPES